MAIETVEETISRISNISADVRITYDMNEEEDSALLDRIDIHERDINVVFDVDFPRYK